MIRKIVKDPNRRALHSRHRHKCWMHLAKVFFLKPPQDAHKTALNSPRHPKMLPRRPKTPMDCSKTPPDLDFAASRPEFSKVFTCKIVNC